MTKETSVRNTLKSHRQQAGLTQQGLADLVGVTRQTIISIEKGHYTPTIGLALGLAESLEVSVETLFQLQRGNGDGK